MEITRHTFNEQLESIIEAINESSFIAIDGEFTGLDLTDSGHAAPFDTPEERYSKIRQGCSEFLLIQFGLCAFRVDEEKHKYEAKPYNFYLFPKPHNRNAPDRRFMCQSSSIDFLLSQGFDFNKLFREGIPYLTPEQENKLKTELERKHNEANKESSDTPVKSESRSAVKIPIPEKEQEFINNICKQISKFLEDDGAESLVIPPCNGFQRKLIYQTVEEKFPLVHIETKTGETNLRHMLVVKAKNEEDKLKLQLDKQNLEKMELDLQVGFSKVIRAITAAGKLVVGHNMFLDVFHVLNHFHCGLPTDLEDFKLATKSVFPRLLDTKLMANTQPFQEHISSSTLEDLKQILQKPPFLPATFEFAEGFDQYRNEQGALHEAGYDALVTARCFATMINYLGTLQNTPVRFTAPSSPLVEPFVNKLFLMRINDIPYLNLDGPDLEAKRDHVFHVTFPKEWRLSDLYSLFQPFGNIQVSWLSETSAYVGLYKKENAAKALTALTKNIGSYRVISYASHLRNRSAVILSAPAASSSPSIPPQKRKTDQEDANVGHKRVRLSSEGRPSYPVIVEEDENLNNSSTEETDRIKDKDGSPQDPEPLREDITEKDTDKDKLFEESDTWG